MLTVAEALSAIVDEITPFDPQPCGLSDALGCVLASSVVSDTDSPPFDKALMDGYAVIAGDVRAGVELSVLEEVTAGRVPTRSLSTGQTIRIMTGAPLPQGCDAVVRVEDSEMMPADDSAEPRVRIHADHARPGQNIIRRGTSLRVGAPVISAGRRLRAQELAALAETGHATVSIRRHPRIAVLATGDELVPVDQPLGPGQIRNSNETMLVAQIIQAGGEAVPLGIARDNREDLRRCIQQGLQQDVLLLSGGVSAGKLDLVPSELEHAGVRQVFHKVQIKPGKPLWFGMLRRDGHTCCVFGLPGNPVSSMVCFERFVRTAIRRLTGEEPAIAVPTTARLLHAHEHRDDRETCFPARREGTGIRLMNWHGSSDLQSTAHADCMAIFPAEPRSYAAGDDVPVLDW